MDITKIDLSGYDLSILAYTEINDASIIPNVQYKLTFGASTDPNMYQLLKDVAVMSALRSDPSPAVKEAYEQLLTVMAISK